MADGNGWTPVILVGLLVFGAYRCSHSDDAAVANSGSTETTALPFSSSIDEDAIAETAREAVEDSTYVDAGAPYGCTEDCSGHEAGFAWARDNEVEDANDCGGNSYSFIEGCQAYAEELETAREDAEAEAVADAEYGR